MCPKTSILQRKMPFIYVFWMNLYKLNNAYFKTREKDHPEIRTTIINCHQNKDRNVSKGEKSSAQLKTNHSLCQHFPSEAIVTESWVRQLSCLARPPLGGDRARKRELRRIPLNSCSKPGDSRLLVSPLSAWIHCSKTIKCARARNMAGVRTLDCSAGHGTDMIYCWFNRTFESRPLGRGGNEWRRPQPGCNTLLCDLMKPLVTR